LLQLKRKKGYRGSRKVETKVESGLRERDRSSRRSPISKGIRSKKSGIVELKNEDKPRLWVRRASLDADASKKTVTSRRRGRKTLEARTNKEGKSEKEERCTNPMDFSQFWEKEKLVLHCD